MGEQGQSTKLSSENTPKRPIVHENDTTSSCSPESTDDKSFISDSSEHPIDSEERLAKSRDRNRQHARRTRLRKKQQLESLQKTVKELQEENKLLKQTIE